MTIIFKIKWKGHHHHRRHRHHHHPLAVPPPTVTTTVNPVGSAGTTESFVVDVSTNPYLRSLDVAFCGHSLRPQRQIYYFFDDVNVSDYCQRASVMLVNGQPEFNDTWGNPDRITYLANSATIINVSTDPTTGNTILYLANVIGTFPGGVSVTGSKSGAVGVVTDFQHRHGTSNVAGGANSITLAQSANSTSGYYIGNTIFLCTGNAGVNGVIAQYNGVTRVANVSTNWSFIPGANTKYSIGSHYVERDGTTQGVFVLPNLPTLKFRTGERIFRVIDTPTNIPENASTRADFRWLGLGLTEVKNDITIQHPQAPTPPPPTPVTPTPTPPRPTPRPGRKRDPVAQSFFVDEGIYPSGMFLTSADLFFATKDPLLPVTVQVRPVIGGFPHSTDVLKGGEITIDPRNVKISSNPNTQNSLTATTFTFSKPLFLDPGASYAIVVLTDSQEYEVFVSELGQKIIGTNRIVSTQPYLGSFFKSQNGDTWTPVQEEDLMFTLKKAVFPTGSPGTIDFYEQVPSQNINVDSMYIHTTEDIYSNTSLSYMYSKDSGAAYANVTVKQTQDLDSRFIIPATVDGVFRLRGTLSTNDRNLSPVLFTEKLAVLGSENLINDLPIDNAAITIINGGAGYTVPTSISCTITGGGGSGANAFVGAVSGGAVTEIVVDNKGSGYTGQANIAITGGGFTTQANAIISSETRSEGGPAFARYVTRVITLAEGFDAGDLRAYVTAYKPLNTDILLYYKIRNLSDPETFTQKTWVPMQQKTSTSVYSEDPKDFVEYEYSAGANTAWVAYTSGTTTYDRFQQFAIKIVLRSSSTTVIPVAYDLRAIALPPSGT
jgi:hypothetical protein